MQGGTGVALPARIDLGASPAWAARYETRVLKGSPGIRIEYPKIQLKDPALTRRVNEELLRLVQKERRQFYDLYQEAKRDGWYNPDVADWYLDISYEAGVVSEELVSVVFYVESYSGGAHGAHYFLSYNVAVGPKGPVALEPAALFLSGTNPRKLLSDLCLAELRRQGLRSAVEGELTELSGELKVFSITTRGLVFYFGDYAIASYAEGDFVVTVPYSALLGILDPAGPLGVAVP
jgi:hypothetical protein